MIPCRKKQIADSFSKASSTYDDFAFVQKKIATHLSGMLPHGNHIKSILETGCGTGFYTAMLADAYAGTPVLSFDLSYMMTKKAAGKLLGADNVHFITADAEHIPVSTDTMFDLITSNGVLQWFSDMKKAVAQYRAMLNPCGTLLVSFFGSRTLCELADTIREAIDDNAAIPADFFPNTETVRATFQELFPCVEFQKRTISKTYPGLPAMLRTLKMTGVAPSGGTPVIRTRGDMKKVEKKYLERTGRVTASYEVFIVKACMDQCNSSREHSLFVS